MTDIYSTRGGKNATLAKIYQAKKSGDRSVNVLKQQFQSKIESKLGHEESRHHAKSRTASNAPATNGTEVRKLQREKSFDEARNAVQSQIEKIFQKAAKNQHHSMLNSTEKGKSTGAQPGSGRASHSGPVAGGTRYTMHGVSHLTPDDIPMISPLPVHHGITLKALLDKKRRNESLENLKEEATSDLIESSSDVSSSSSSSLSSPTIASPPDLLSPKFNQVDKKSFRIHSEEAREKRSNLARYTSMDSLIKANAYEIKAPLSYNTHHKSFQYSSMLNLDIHAHTNRVSMKNQSSPDVKLSSKRNKLLTDASINDPSSSSSSAMTQKRSQQQAPIKPDRKRIATKPDGKPGHLIGGTSANKGARDAKLHHLGRMSPEEQLDKFLQSVEEVNAENEEMLNQEMEFYEHKAVSKAPNERVFTKNKNLRRETSVSNRWHSVDNLNEPKKRAQGASGKKVKKTLPEPRKSPPKDSGNNLREINGPKSFSSMSQLDNLQRGQRVLPKGKTSPIKTESRRISPMDVNSSQSRTSSSNEDAAVKRSRKRSENNGILPKNLIPASSRRIKVAYLGCLPLNNQGSDLSSLQLPLKELYFSYIEMRKSTNTVKPSSLEITETGLKVNYVRESQKGVQELFNPFPTIAVWAAVRFIYKRETDKDGKTRFSFAFLPLISDPGDAEKNQLFNPLVRKDWKLAASVEHPAMFACIMRRNGSSKLLECHGFVCDTKDDAIEIASNLYKSLMETMKRQHQEADHIAAYHYYQNQDMFNANQGQPTRPSKNASKKRINDDDNDAIYDLGDPSRNDGDDLGKRGEEEFPAGRVKRSHSEKAIDDETNMSNSNQSQIKRSISERRSMDDSDVTIGKKRGDIYTKVAMPRSKSFMNVSGQYNLQELFRELKEKEGIESIDDILRQVISPDGMSFNKISPVYKELLMKLAMSMSKDEIFIRSKNIMMQEKSKKVNNSQPSFLKWFHFLGNKKQQQKANMSNASFEGSKKFKLNKDDIGEPQPLNEDTKRELTKQWMKASPQLAQQQQQQLPTTHEPLNQHQKTVFAKKRNVRTATTTTTTSTKYDNDNNKKLPQRRQVHHHEDQETDGRDVDNSSYMSCSECGYQSVCGTNCSCSMAMSNAEDETRDTNRPQKMSTTSSSSAKSKKSSVSSFSSSSSNRQDQRSKPFPSSSSSGSSSKSRRDGLKSRPKKKLPAPQPPPSITSSCDTCRFTCQYCGNGNKLSNSKSGDTTEGGSTTCYSCSIYSDADSADVSTELRGLSKHHSESVSSYDFSGIDSPQTAWKRKQEEQARNSSSRHITYSDSETEDESKSSIKSVIRNNPNANKSQGNSAEHVNGLFRNLNLLDNDQRNISMITNPKKEKYLKSGKAAVSLDSLSSTSNSSTDCSTSSGASTLSRGQKGPRPAYSESNMHNSLGYLP